MDSGSGFADDLRRALGKVSGVDLVDLTSFSRIIRNSSSFSVSTDGGYIDPSDADLPDLWADGYHAPYSVTKSCGSMTFTLTHKGEFDTIYTLTCSHTCEFGTTGTPGCCKKWVPIARLAYSHEDEVTREIETSLEGCIACNEGWYNDKHNYLYVIEALRSFTMLCDECSGCDCGGIFRMKRGFCRKTKIIRLLGLRLPETFGRLPTDLVRYFTRFL
jgi:hypothetical protein